MSSFAALMALSATQTRQADAAVQSALAERQRKEAQKRKEQEERERRERELENKLRLKRFEEEKREQERRQRMEQERESRDRELRRREDEERDRLRYGPKKAGQRTDSKGYPVSSAGGRKGGVSPPGSDDEGSAANALTREEKRKRRLESELSFGRKPARRSTQGGGYSKAGRRLPGGAVDITTTSMSLADPGGSLSVRQRLAAEPAMLIKLNVNKRDTRTIDEILQDRAKAKATQVLQGDQAKEFNDWFGKGKAKEAASKKATPVASQTDSASTSRANTPAVATQPKGLSGSTSPASRASAAPRSSTTSKPAASQRSAASKATPAKSMPSASSRTPTSASRPLPSSKLGASAAKPPVKKRPRSPSRSVSPAPKRRAASSGPRNDISQEIWKLFGKDRSQYVGADVMSDDEDMEADARDLEMEELRSARIARREEELAIEEERRHEEEKRRKRKEKDVRERRG